MRHPTHNTAKLPQKLLDEIGVSLGDYGGNSRKRGGPANRKEQRKVTRVEKKSSRVHNNRTSLRRNHSTDSIGGDLPSRAIVNLLQPGVKATSVQPKPPKSILKAPKSISITRQRKSDILPLSPPVSPPPKKPSRAVQERLAADDAEIAALENALGVKDKKKLPKSFADDGLDSLLEGIDDAVGLEDRHSGKRKRSEEEQWLERKRRKAQPTRSDIQHWSSSNGSEDSGDDDSHGTTEMQEYPGEEEATDGGTHTDGVDDSDTLDEGNNQQKPATAKKRARENPYVAPSASETIKYVPPSLRVRSEIDSELLSSLRRQIQGLLNRLSEANLLSILSDVGQLYRDHPRQHVSTVLLELLMGLLSDPSALQDTFIILHAGFLAAIYKTVGTSFGAQAIQKIDEEFRQNYGAGTEQEGKRKRLTNLMSLLSELYNFQVIGSNLIYDYIRLCLEDLSESNTELLLKIIRNSGPQLRQDDPTSLKDIIVNLQKSISDIGEENLSVRTKFMIETISNLKNNRMKTGIMAAAIASEHTVRMKKTLGSLNTRTLKASEPLRVGLHDLRNRDKVGTWWLVGAGYKGEGREDDTCDEPIKRSQADRHESLRDDKMSPTAIDLASLAKEQRMNTEVRRSIFTAIMSSSDYNDAYGRLMKLRLKKTQEIEIPKVLIHCAGAERIYNPFYTFLSRRVCSDRKLKMSFQFSLWDLFKQMEGGDPEMENERDEGDQQEGNLGLRSLVNLAKMFGVLIAEDGLRLAVLKNLNLIYLQSKTRNFVEVLLITTILRSQQNIKGSRNEKALLDIVLKPKEIAEMAPGLQYFLKKVVMKTDVAGSKLDKETVKWGCRIAVDALAVLSA